MHKEIGFGDKLGNNGLASFSQSHNLKMRFSVVGKVLYTFPHHKKGFTLLELIVVIIIIGILATIALPQFGRTKERALANEAKANLKLIAAAEKIYKMESNNNSYVFCNCNCSGTAAQCCENTTAGCNYLLKLSLTTQNWIYMAVPVGLGPTGTFVAYADRQGSGGYLNCQYSINQSQDEPVVASGVGTCP